MCEPIISQEDQKVKQEEQCGIEGCQEPSFRDRLCWYHFLEEVVEKWDAEEREEMDYIFGDPVDRDWYGYEPGEVLA